MTKIKLKIVLTCLSSVILILCALLVVVNVAIPKNLEVQARKAIEHEKKEYDPQDEKSGINFLSSSVAYLEIGQTNEDLIYLTESEKAILAFCAENNVVCGKFYGIKDENRNIVLAVYASDEDLSEKYEYVLYVDIKAILNYVRWLNGMFCCTVIIVGAVICVIGLKLGKTIESAQEIRQSFFQNASHELKTPLMAIQGYAEGIVTGVLPTTKSASVILEESDRMTALIEELLALSKIDSAQTTTEVETINLSDVINSVACSFAPAFKNNQKQLKIDLCDDVTTLCDQNQMRKAVSNLVGNALRHCKTCVTVSCKEENDKIVLKISDDGDGISKEDVPHIFERFYTGKNGNTGIALALTKEIIKLYGGDIKAYNRNGAVFEVTLPKNKRKKT